MSYEEDLRRLREIKKHGCVAYARENDWIYYSVNGIERGPAGETKISKELTSMYDTTNIIRCTSSDSYTIVDPQMLFNYVISKENAKKIFDSLDLNKTINIEGIIEPMKYDSSYDNHNWCCCERKIIGYFNDNLGIPLDDNSVVLYVIERPCLLCIPLVNDAYYLDDNLCIKHDYYSHEMIDDKTMKITI